jgi:hypothetical protein
MAEFKIPGGNSKGTPIGEAESKDLGYWIQRIEGDLEKDPNKKYADRDRAWIQAARAELQRRKNGGAQQQAPAQRPAAPAPQHAIQRAETSLGKAIHDPKAVTKHLQELSANYHVVSPATRVDALPEGCGVAVSYVIVDPNTDKDGPGEVYKVGDKLGLSGTTLAKIGAAAGVDWDPRLSGRLDDGSDPHYCHYRAVGYVRNFDGSVRTLTGEVEIDAREGSPQIEEITTKAENATRWENGKKVSAPRDPRPQILELRKFLIRHAERKAKNRAIADMGVKRSYAPAELQKPFAVARLMWTGESRDPELRRVFAEKTADAMIGGMSALYGRQPAALPERAPAPQLSAHRPPPVGSVEDDAEDYDGYTYETEGEEQPQSSPQAAAQPAQDQSSAGSEYDRGDDPNQY